MRERGHNFTGKRISRSMSSTPSAYGLLRSSRFARMAMSNDRIETFRDHRRAWTLDAADIKADKYR